MPLPSEDARTDRPARSGAAVSADGGGTHRFLLSDLVPESTERHPTAVAVACDDETVTWEELDRRAGRLASVLIRVGVGAGDRVGIYLHKSIESVVAVHGILRSGAAYVPIDPMAPVETVATIIADCGIEILVTHEPRRAGVVRLASLVSLRTIIGLDPVGPGDSNSDSNSGSEPTSPPAATLIGWDEVAAETPVPPVSVLGDDLAYVMYTSGSTGTPKGIMHTHRSGLAYAMMAARVFGLGPEDRMANFSPLHFDMSTFEVLAGVSAGSRVVIIPEPYLRLPASLAHYLADQRCTTLYTVPSLLQQLLARGGLADRDLSAVRWVLPAGEVFPPEPLQELIDLLPHARFSNVYGPAEVNQCTYYHFSRVPAGGRPLPIGYRCPDTELLVVDDDDIPITGPEQGQLLVRTATMMAGYWNRPDLDAQGFVDRPGPGGRSQRWYRTGDVVAWNRSGEVEPSERSDAGPCLLYFGRKDNQIKIRGNRVELEMVEAAVGSLEAVERVVVGVRTDESGDSRLVARFVAAIGGPDGGESSSDPAGDPGTWRRQLAARLPVYAIPDDYQPVEDFPLTPSGKIDRRAVRQAIAGGSPTAPTK